jgi:8-oxo-dGTP pyrophosphatase MutT (NUDIX family)
MVQRHARSPVAPSAFVFPGGTVRDDDLALAVQDRAELARALSARSDTPLGPPEAAAYYACALRELFEEAGVLLVRDVRGELVYVDRDDPRLQERLESVRLALQARDLSIGSMLQDHGWRPAFDLLVPFSHWVTPRLLAARFDTRFFVAVMPPGQSALHDTIETSQGVWLTPAQALEPEYHTVFATVQHLQRLNQYPNLGALLAFARTKPIRMVSPELQEGSDGMRVSLPAGLEQDW